MLANGESVQPYKALLKDAQVIKVQFIYFVATENILKQSKLIGLNMLVNYVWPTYIHHAYFLTSLGYET